MNAFLINFFGMIALISSVIGIFPQVYKSFKTKSVEDVSMLMMINFFICSAAWFSYGIMTSAIYVILSNIVGMIATATSIWQIIYYKKKNNKK